MARDDDDDDSLPPLGENTEKFLEQAKKGQARSFLLVCKGNKVKYLAVKKKPVKKNELNEAKKSGYKGEGYFGVITGKGMELVFNLSMADGYTSEPVKDKILKDFLEEKADFKCKPTIAIVATLPDVPFDDEDLKNPLIARFLALDVLITQVLDVNPAAEAELVKTTSGIRLLLQDGEFQTAEPSISTLETRLQELLNGAPPNIPVPPSPLGPTSTSQPIPPAPPVPPNTPAPTAPAPTVDNDALKLKLQEALNKLVPQLKQAVVTYPEKKVELLTPVAQIKKQMDSGDLQEAKKGILAVGQLLKSLMSQAATTPSTSESQPQAVDPLRAEYERKLAAIKPSYDKALQDMLGDTSKFRTVMTYVTEQAEAGIFGNAIKALERLTQAVEKAISEAPKSNEQDQKSGEGTVKSAAMAFKIGRLEWAMACDEVQQQLRSLKGAILQAGEDFDNSSLTELDNATDQLYGILGDEAQNLQDRFDENIDSQSQNEQQATLDEVLKQMDRYESFLSGNPLVDAATSNPFGVTVSVKDRLSNQISKLRTAFLKAKA